MKTIATIIDENQFTADCQNKWDFDCPILSISSRGYDRSKKSFYVGYFFGGELLIGKELFDKDFEKLKLKVRKWYKDNFLIALGYLSTCRLKSRARW